MSILPVDLQNKKDKGEKITVLTAYDYSLARMIDTSGVDAILVGDSLGMVVLGYDSTVPVTMDDMLHHCKAVRRGVKSAMLVGDMPFMSYHTSRRDAVMNAGRFFKEAGCDAVKLEGGTSMAPVVERIVKAGMPVMGHIGLTPQTAGALGGYKVQGKDLDSGRRLYEDAKALESAGAFALVLECIPSAVGKILTEALTIPTIGIGAGPYCDGQVLVSHDLIGMFGGFSPHFVKKYVDLAPLIMGAFKNFRAEVEGGAFPGEDFSFAGGEEAAEEIKKILRQNSSSS